jgi:hypothetical protein
MKNKLYNREWLKMWIEKPEVKQSKVTNHLFEDGEQVIIKETGETVTIDHWWYASNQRSWTTQYNIVEHPSTWYSEHELQKINITGVIKMNKEIFIKDLFSNHFAPYTLLIENGFKEKDVFGLFGGNLLSIVDGIVDNMTENEMIAFRSLNC